MKALRWGAVLTAALVGLVILMSYLQPGTVTEAGFVEAEQALREAMRLLEAGQVDQAERVFMQEADPLYHRLDPVLRPKEPELAAALWRDMGRIELAFYNRDDLDPQSLVRIMQESIPRLKQAAERLGLDPAWTTE